MLFSPDSSGPTNVDIVAVHDTNQPIDTAWEWGVSIPDKDVIASATVSPRQTRDVKGDGTRERSSSRQRRAREKDPQGRDENTPSSPAQSEQEARQTATATGEAARNEATSTNAERQATALDAKGKGKSTEDTAIFVLPPLQPTAEQTSADKEPVQHSQVEDSNSGKAPDHHRDDSTQPSGRRRSSINSRGPSLKPAKPSNWLSGLTKLGGQIGQPRVMAFGYDAPDVAARIHSPRQDARFDQPLKQLSTTLISRLLERRKENNNPKAPLVFIGTGLGCLIIQEVIRLSAESEESSEQHCLLDMTAGILFLDAPTPILKKQPKEESSKEGTKAEEPKKEPGAPRVDFPPAANAHSRLVNPFLRSHAIDSGELWERFQSAAVSKPLSVVWFYDPGSMGVGSYFSPTPVSH